MSLKRIPTGLHITPIPTKPALSMAALLFIRSHHLTLLQPHACNTETGKHNTHTEYIESDRPTPVAVHAYETNASQHKTPSGMAAYVLHVGAAEPGLLHLYGIITFWNYKMGNGI